MRTSSRFFLALCVLALTGNLAFVQAQKAAAPPKTTSNPEKAPDFSDADKKKMAEIAERPEIKDAIQAAWDNKRRQDIDYIYNINSSAHFSDMSGPEYATFRDQIGRAHV